MRHKVNQTEAFLRPGWVVLIVALSIVHTVETR